MKITDKSDLEDRLWNCDETGVCTSVVSSTVLERRGAKWVHETTGGSGREINTIHVGGSASGRRLPSFIVYKGKHLYSSWTKEDLQVQHTPSVRAAEWRRPTSLVGS